MKNKLNKNVEIKQHMYSVLSKGCIIPFNFLYRNNFLLFQIVYQIFLA